MYFNIIRILLEPKVDEPPLCLSPPPPTVVVDSSWPTSHFTPCWKSTPVIPQSSQALTHWGSCCLWILCFVSCIGIVPETKEVVIHKYKTPMVSPHFFCQSQYFLCSAPVTRCALQKCAWQKCDICYLLTWQTLLRWCTLTQSLLDMNLSLKTEALISVEALHTYFIYIKKKNVLFDSL